MSGFVEVMKADDLKDGMMKKVTVGDLEVLISRAGGRFYCSESRCPHLGGDLSKGSLNGTVIECPLHHSRFDLADGRVVRWMGGAGLLFSVSKALKPPRPLKTYEVRVEGDRVLVNTG